MLMRLDIWKIVTNVAEELYSVGTFGRFLKSRYTNRLSEGEEATSLLS